MTDYIITIRDSCFPRSDTYRDIYYPDERHNPMPLEEIVRCRDCKHYDAEPSGEIGTCDLGLEDTGLYSIVEPNGFCAWAERKEGGE